MTSHDQLIEEACKFLDGSSLCYVTMLVSLVTISIAMMEVFLICHVTSPEHMFKVLCEFMGVCHGESVSCRVWWPLV